MEGEITGLHPEQNFLNLRERPALHFDWLSLDVGAVSRPSAKRNSHQALGILTLLSRERRPKRPQTIPSHWSGSCRLKVVLALRRRWPQRELQLQQRRGQLDRAIQKVLKRAHITLIEDDYSYSGSSLLCTGSQGHAWLTTAGLPMDSDGRIHTDRYLRVKDIHTFSPVETAA